MLNTPTGTGTLPLTTSQFKQKMDLSHTCQKQSLQYLPVNNPGHEPPPERPSHQAVLWIFSVAWSYDSSGTRASAIVALEDLQLAMGINFNTQNIQFQSQLWTRDHEGSKGGTCITAYPMLSLHKPKTLLA